MVDDGDSLHTEVDPIVPVKPDEQRLVEGTEIDGYIIDGILGRGGMGIVYSATHAVIGKRCAVKVLRAEVSHNPDTVNRFMQEARAVNQIGHPNIIDIFDFGTLPDGRLYHLMDLLVGESLRRRLRRGRLHPSEAASVIEGISSALIAAHEKGFIHRDLKPDNIYLCTAERSEWSDVKLLDFGLAKLMPDAGVAPFKTKTGVMLGTPEYMSPEQARGHSVDYRTDVYALGVVMFEILTGQRPFPSGPDAFSTLQYHADEPAPSIQSLLPDLLPEMVQLVDALLAKEPAARPSLAAVRTVIKRLRSTQLPTKSMAGVEMSTLSNPALTLPPAHVGAEPLVEPPPLQRKVSQPIAAAGIPLDSFRPEPLPPPPAHPPRRDTPPTLDERMVAAAKVNAASAPAQGTTKLGVPPPPARPETPLVLHATAAPMPAVAGSRRAWLLVASVLVVAAAIALLMVIVVG